MENWTINIISQTLSYLFISCMHAAPCPSFVQTFLLFQNLLPRNSLSLFLREEQSLALPSLLVASEMVTSGRWPNRVVCLFGPSREGSVIRCLSVWWLTDTNSYESYKGLPQSHISNASSSFIALDFLIFLSLKGVVGFIRLV